LDRLPHPLTSQQLHQLGSYYWYIQTQEVSLNYIFDSPDTCQPLFENLLQHNQLLGSPESIRHLFGLKRPPRGITSTMITPNKPMGCFKAFYKSNWVKCYDKQGFILRLEVVINNATDFVAKKSLGNIEYLTKLGQLVCQRLERSCLTAVTCGISAQGYYGLVESRHDASNGRVYSAIRPDHPAQQALLATLLSLSHCPTGFNNKEYRAKHRQQHGVLLNTSQATYHLRKFCGHGLIESVSKCRRYQLTKAGRSMVTFLVKLYSHLFRPVVNAITSGVRTFKTCIADDPIAFAMQDLFVALGLTCKPLPQLS
jgi:hypothetical protein